MKSILFWISIFLYSPFTCAQMPIPKIEFSPGKYVCYRPIKPLKMDGKLDDESWGKAEWTSFFL